MHKRTIPLLLAIAALVIATGTAAAAVRGSPDITASLQDDTVAAGDETTLEVVLVNSGDIDFSSGQNPPNSEVTTARGLTVEMEDSSAPISITTGTRSLGSLGTDAPTTAAFDISVDEDAEPGTYRVPVELSYRYYDSIADSGARSESSVTRTRTVTVTVSDDATFDVTNVDSNAQVGSTGTVAVTVENTGQTAANNSDVTLTSQNGDLTFGERTESTRSVDSWAPGESRTFRYDVTATDDAQVDSYPFQLNVAFDDPDGVRKESTGTSVSVTPDPEQTFTLSDVQSTLRAGEEGTITATVTNDGPRDVDNVVINWASDKNDLSPQETQVAVGNLESGASTEVAFTVDATDSAQAGSKQFDFVASYRNTDGDREESDTLEAQAAVAPSQDEFSIESANTSIGVGQSGNIEVTVTNTRNQTFSDITAKLFTSSPINADDDESYIDSLAPGESKTITFSVSADGSALQKAYPVSIDFRYEEPDGDSSISDTYRVPIEVTDPNGGGGLPLTAIGGVALVLVLAVGGYMRFR
ncbi:COG1361 S-layer family protein [Halomicroarcula sp. F28]|uniref:COG1361 S-layer family protein n=1 Tax=Haloarcula salinisoli TaxID=2487746 RepID=UPI001C73550F|nr:COG1361 S-layer family protein [Halomicroarcula salinisoli]MBX0287777.1 COG1361 S-layer family protein [Halomicroarcula salinisoli]